MGSSRLVVLVDGKALPEAEARAMWTRFSAYLDTHRGDFAGFAKSEGLASARPETRDGQAVLVLSVHAMGSSVAGAKSKAVAARPRRKGRSG